MRIARSASRITNSAKPPGRGLADVAGCRVSEKRYTTEQGYSLPCKKPVTRSPTVHAVTPSPIFSTTPAISLPTTRPGGAAGWAVYSGSIGFKDTEWTLTLKVWLRMGSVQHLHKTTYRISPTAGAGISTLATMAVFPGAVMSAFMVEFLLSYDISWSDYKLQATPSISVIQEFDGDKVRRSVIQRTNGAGFQQRKIFRWRRGTSCSGFSERLVFRKPCMT